jgi:hypothetical protein
MTTPEQTPLKIQSFVIELPTEKPEEAINHMAEVIRSHSGSHAGGTLSKVKIDVKCKNGKQVKCEVDGLWSAKDCVKQVSAACGAEGGTATFSGTV